MREILFRGKRIDNGEWVEGDYLRERNDRPDKLNACIVQAHRSFDVDPKTVGQFTGLPDKNGKKVFEGDRYKTIWNKETEYEVIFANGAFCAKSKDGYGVLGFDSDENVLDTDWFEIIGNIHEEK